jgi:hypothetical protein
MLWLDATYGYHLILLQTNANISGPTNIPIGAGWTGREDISNTIYSITWGANVALTINATLNTNGWTTDYLNFVPNASTGRLSTAQ